MEFMLTYHEIHHPDSTFLIQETNPFVMNLLREKDNILANDLQVTLTIRDYNQNATVRLDVDLIITDQEGTNRPPTTKEENDICTICFENCNYVNNICSCTCGRKVIYESILDTINKEVIMSKLAIFPNLSTATSKRGKTIEIATKLQAADP
ncbi:hypothetical protein YC2023_093864 [Brassica napus]